MPSKRAPKAVVVRRVKRVLPTSISGFPWELPGLSRAERVIAFLEFLQVTKGMKRGSKMRLLPHQREFVERVYAAGVDVRLAISSVGRGNGKTGLASGLVLCHMIGPEAEPRGEIYSAATSTQQAGIVFREVEAIVDAEPAFAQFKIKATSFWNKMIVAPAITDSMGMTRPS